MRNLRTQFTFLIAWGFISLCSDLQAQSCFELVWSDEFNYTGLPDSTLWTNEVGGGGWGNNELQYYTNRRLENSRVEEGNLIIEALKENYEGNNYTSARLITYPNGHSFKYGKIEARMKLPYGQGIWPALWMLGDGVFEGTPWPACGEIDIMEMVGGTGKDDVVHGTIHWSDANGNHASYGGEKKLDAGIFADEFHLFSIEWTETTIKWYLDGTEYHVADITPGHMSEFHEDFFIILNLAVGGNWPGQPDASTLFPQKMYVDFIRVYQLNTSPEIVGDTVVLAAEKGIRYSTVESETSTYSWSVPEGAEIIEGQDSHSILVDWGCDTGTISCDVTTICGQYDLNLGVKPGKLSISGKESVEVNETDLTYSVHPTRQATYEWFIPDGVFVHSKIDSNFIKLDWNDLNGEILLRLSNYCIDDSASKLVTVVKQLPYPDPDQPHKLPGTILSVNYDTGGEGFAYHDFEMENLGSGSRQDEGVDTEPNDGGENIGWLESGEWLEYTIEVESTDLYDVAIRVASPNNLGIFKLLFDGDDRTGLVSVPQTGSWTNFTSISLKGIQLYDSDSQMSISIVNGQFNMGRLQFTVSGSTSVEDFSNSNQIYIYPTLTTGIINIKNIFSAYDYSITDMLGRIVKKGTVQPDSFISVQELTPGAYYLFLHGNQEIIGAGRFQKED